MELTKLREAGLGKRRITFDNKRSGHGKVRQVLETIYPKLKCQNGAFEILRAERGGTSCKLVLIEMSKDGYTVPYLKEQVSCNTILYIRPMQNDLSMSKVIMKTDDSIKSKCQNCSKEVPLGDMKIHLAQCTEGESTASRASIPHSYCEDSSDDDCLVTGIEENCPSSSSASIDDKTAWRRELSALFPFHTAGQIEVSMIGASSVDEAANNLMETYNPDSRAAESHSEERAVTDLPTLLREFQGYHMKFGIEELCIDRDAVWADTLRFYKRKVAAPESLCKQLEVSFKGEDGLDGGALKVEYFNMAWEQATSRLFEGNVSSLVPIKDTTKIFLFRLMGMMVVHTVLQSGPVKRFPKLSPAVVSCMLGNEVEEIYRLLIKHDIPLNAATENIHNLIEELDTAKSDQAIKELLGENSKSGAYWEIVNACHWPISEAIGIHNKSELIQEIIYNEVIRSRKDVIQEIKHGLDVIGFFGFMSKHPHQFKILFCATEEKFGPDEFKALLLESKPSNFAEQQAFEWFNEFISEGDSPLSDDDPESIVKALLAFTTGWQTPSMFISEPRIKVEFLLDDDDHALPTSSACLQILRIPTVHSTKVKFREAMITALKYGRQGFPNP